ncbi:MAG: GSCFA domain-containing protein [Cyclobacteriaceae bacterium]
MGSCFSEIMGRKLQEQKFSIDSNPLGILYNPVSIHRILRMALHLEDVQPFTAEVNGRFVHYDAHSRINGNTAGEVISSVKSRVASVRNRINKATWLILTYGTSLVYQLNGRVVGNCHKQPSAIFTRSLMNIEELLEDAGGIIPALLKHNPKLRIVVTVSPIRHIRDSLELSSVSKSLLRVYCHELVQRYEQIQYFPSYELLMDDLRDYRFYDRDMIHPSSAAEDYIFDKFAMSYFSEETIDLLGEWNKLRKALEHRPFNPAGEDHRQFLSRTHKRLLEISGHLDVSTEIQMIENQLSK